MANIFEGEQSIYRSGTTDRLEILRRISSKYMADHPWQTFGMCPFVNCGFEQSEDGCYTFDFDREFPDAKMGSYCYMMSYAEFETDDTRAIHIDARYYSELYINGELIAKTEVEDEAIPKRKRIIYSFKKGKTAVFLKARKNSLGFKAIFGEGLLANKPIYFKAPFIENAGSLGWLYTKPFEEDIYKNPEDFPHIEEKQPDFWLPSYKGYDKDVFGQEKGYVYACSNLMNSFYTNNVTFGCDSNEPYSIYVDGEKVIEGTGRGDYAVKVSPGLHYVCAEIDYSGTKELKFEIKAFANGEEIAFQPFKFVRSDDIWLSMGVLKEKNEALTKAFDINLLGETADGYTYYRAGLTNKPMRPIREDLVYGAWTYPLGVVMYGLYETAKALGSDVISDYATKHIQASTNIHKYATWDRDSYGSATINATVVNLDMLDFCGSFGNAILVGSELTEDNKTMLDTAHYISDYIKNKQERLENGMFFRIRPGTIHDNTIWADDLYMSVPFLCRYYLLTGDRQYLDDAVNQILCFREYLYMPSEKLMSHVYNLTYKTNTKLAWGRANGWTLFSFSELLAALPEDHEKRSELLEFFRELCEGVLAHQDENGMWHQLVNDQSSYAETSCTAMFTCVFSRGVRNGWLTDKKFADSAILGWEGLCNNAIDSKGNVYGVCVASRYSFRAEYYKDELLWHTNDLHGIGIVMLAGVEVDKLINALN